MEEQQYTALGAGRQQGWVMLYLWLHSQMEQREEDIRLSGRSPSEGHTLCIVQISHHIFQFQYQQQTTAHKVSCSCQLPISWDSQGWSDLIEACLELDHISDALNPLRLIPLTTSCQAFETHPPSKKGRFLSCSSFPQEICMVVLAQTELGCVHQV